MKRIIALIMVICVIFCACGSTRTEETTNGENTPVTEDGFYRNPLNGEKMTEAYNGRVFAVTINNVSPALPHRGVSDADVFFEMFINDYCTRGLALFSDVRSVASIGSIRSTRYNFTDIALAYNTVVIHANASQQVLDDMNSSGVLSDGHEIRQCAVENNVTIFTALDTVKVLLDVLEETTLTISTIDA